MRIARLVIEGGFLDGLDLTFSEGLNVLVGGRGTGKTSVIELIRFCLNVPNYTEQSGRRSVDHAAAVLGQGEVTVFMTDGDVDVQISRAWNEDEPRSNSTFDSPIIFSQTDIESIGLEPAGRLQLVDSFVTTKADLAQERKLIAQIQSLTAESRSIGRECESLNAQLGRCDDVRQSLALALSNEKKLSTSSKSIASKQKDLDKLNEVLSQLSVRSGVFQRTIESLESFASRLEEVISSLPTIEKWPIEGGQPDLLLPARNTIYEVSAKLKNATREVGSLLRSTSQLQKETISQRIPVDSQVRALRKEVEQLQAGAGAVARSVGTLKEQLAQLNTIATLKKEKSENLKRVQSQRGTALDALDALREKRFSNRMKIAERLNSALGPRIRLTLTRSAQFETYSHLIGQALRGSGLRYGELARQLAERISPRELVEAAESSTPKKAKKKRTLVQTPVFASYTLGAGSPEQ